MTTADHLPPRWPLYVLAILGAGLLVLGRVLAVAGDAALVEFE